LRVLIVDDERIIREGLKITINWAKYDCIICGEASNGAEAIEKILSLQPDLVLLDIRMPMVTGIEVILEVQQKGFEGQIIILSGYSDFEYARSALDYGAISYLLKPVDEDKLIEAVCRAKGKVDKEEIFSVYSNQNLKVAQQKLLIDLITDKISWTPSLQNVSGLDLNADAYQIALIGFLPHENDQKLVNIVQDSCFGLSCKIVIFEEKIIVILLGKKTIAQFKKTCSSIISFSPITIFSEVTYYLNEIACLYKQAKRVYDLQFYYLEEENIIYCDKLEHDCKENISFDLVDLSDKLYSYISSCQEDKLNNLIKSMEQYFRFQNMPSAKAVRVLTNIYLLTKRSLEKNNFIFNIDKDLSDDDKSVDKICEYQTLHEIIKYLHHQFNKMICVIAKLSDSNVIIRMQDYLNKNYDSNLKLDTLAKIFGYNSAYLGKLFKHETGENFNSYLDRVRIEKSKTFLLENMKVTDIAVRCGFHDIDYFSRKFKKYVGYSPSAYKKQ